MRENLFRAKRIDNKKWTEGNLVKSSDADQGFGAIIIPIENSNMYLRKKENDLGFEVWHPVIPETVCQYTGLTDKNGRKIFEEDILSGERCHDWGQGGEYELDTCVIKWDGERAAFDPVYWWEGYKHDLKNYEVIGNIFDNPELIGGEK